MKPGSKFLNLMKNTSFTEPELKILYENFNEQSKNQNFIRVEEMIQKMPSSGYLDSINMRIFQQIRGHNQSVYFEDYVHFMDLLIHGNLDNRSKLTFMIISQGKDFIDNKDVDSFVKELVTFSSHSQYNQYKIKMIQNQLKNKLQLNQEEAITYDQFKKVFEEHTNMFDDIFINYNQEDSEVQQVKLQKEKFKNKILFLESQLKELRNYMNRDKTLPFQPFNTIQANQQDKVALNDLFSDKSIQLSWEKGPVDKIKVFPIRLEEKNLSKIARQAQNSQLSQTDSDQQAVKKINRILEYISSVKKEDLTF